MKFFHLVPTWVILFYFILSYKEGYVKKHIYIYIYLGHVKSERLKTNKDFHPFGRVSRICSPREVVHDYWLSN